MIKYYDESQREVKDVTTIKFFSLNTTLDIKRVYKKSDNDNTILTYFIKKYEVKNLISHTTTYGESIFKNYNTTGFILEITPEPTYSVEEIKNLKITGISPSQYTYYYDSDAGVGVFEFSGISPNTDLITIEGDLGYAALESNVSVYQNSRFANNEDFSFLFSPIQLYAHGSQSIIIYPKQSNTNLLAPREIQVNGIIGTTGPGWTYSRINDSRSSQIAKARINFLYPAYEDHDVKLFYYPASGWWIYSNIEHRTIHKITTQDPSYPETFWYTTGGPWDMHQQIYCDPGYSFPITIRVLYSINGQNWTEVPLEMFDPSQDYNNETGEIIIHTPSNMLKIEGTCSLDDTFLLTSNEKILKDSNDKIIKLQNNN